MTKPSFTMSSTTRFLVQLLEKSSVGDTITYQQMSEAAGEPISGGTAALQTAIRRCMRDKDMVFANVRKEGVRRLSNMETVDYATSFQTKVRKASKRAFEIGSKVEFAALPRDAQMRQSANASIMATIAQMTTPSKVLSVERKMPEGVPELPVSAIMKMFER